jgi:3-oxoacyl-[acyl-carrier-protein] synthase I
MNSIVVTAIGMASSLGPSKSACAAARAGLSRPSVAPYRIAVSEDDARDQVTALSCRNLEQDTALERLPVLLRRASDDLLQSAVLGDDAIPCLLNAPALDDEAPLLASIPARSAGRPSIAHRGHAGVVTLLAEGRDLLTNGQAKRCLVGGVDSYIDSETLSQLDAARQLKTPLNGDGFIPGEGAAWLLIERREEADRRGATVLAELGPVTTCQANYSLVADEFIPTGAAWARAMCDALENNPAKAGLLGDIVHDYNGWSRRGREWALAFMRACRLFDGLRRARRSTAAECFGDLGAASAAFSLCTSVTALARGYASGRETLVASASQDGERAVAVLRAV